LLQAYRAITRADRFAAGFFYDASDLARFAPWGFTAEGATLDEAFGPLFRALPHYTPTYFARSYRRLYVGGMFETCEPDLGWVAKEMSDAFDGGDLLCINGLNPDGLGCVLAVPITKRLSLRPHQRRFFTSLASHLASAHHFRRRLRSSRASGAVTEGAEALFDRDGNLLHAEGEASTNRGRRQVEGAVAGIVAARTRWREEPDRCLEAWRPLVAARWTLVDAFEQDGSRYIVARENETQPPGLETLSTRERQVVGLATLGRTNKEIAYHLGLAHSTVRVLLVRAARKLGVTSRSEILNLLPAGVGQRDHSAGSSG
jgi:DNA-binding CsgD family transcriptional regulator